MWWWRNSLRSDRFDIEIGFTDTEGGVSEAGFASLNLGAHVGDDLDSVEENRRRVAADLGLDRSELILMHQVHGNQVEVVNGPRTGEAPQADGVVSATPGLGLVVMVADCTPVLLADPHAGVVGAVHAGRPGMTSRIVDVAVRRMKELGAHDLQAVVGPSVCGRCYEVPPQMRDEAAAVTPQSAAVTWTGTAAIDVAAGVVAQLAENGVPVEWVPGCTRESDRLFSYRRDHGAGRFAGVVVMRERLE